MSYISRIGQSLILSAALFATSCVNEVMENASEQGNAPENSVMTKIINTPSDSEDGTLLLYLSKEAAANFHNGQRIASQTPEGLEVRSFKPIFNMTEQNEKYMRKHQLDRWFIMEFEGMGLDNAAKTLAQFGEVSRVQFNKFVTYGSDTRTAAPSEKTEETSDNVFNDPRLADQCHYYNTGRKTISTAAVAGEDIAVKDVWRELTGGDNEIVVAIIDGPVKYTHEDLKDNMWVNTAEKNGAPGVDDDNNGYVDDVHGYNFAHNGRVSWTRSKDSGHGTHVAGTVAAVNNNGIGVSGVAGGSGNGDGVRIMSCQILSGEKDAGSGGTAKAIEYAADMGACILQNSWGFGAGQIANDSAFANGSTSVELEAFLYFMATKNNPNLEGGIVIFAAGNDGKAVAGYPGAYNEIIAVTAIAPDGLPTYYTNYDRGCNVAATGGEYAPTTWAEQSCVLSTVPTNIAKSGYAYMQGTSMACPHVSGIAALALSYAMDNNIVLTLPELKDIIVSSVTNLNPVLNGFKTNVSGGTLNLASYNNKMGTGLIDAYRVLMAVRGTKCIPLPVGEEVIVNVASYIGDGTNDKIKMVESELSQEVIDALGIENIKWMGGKLMLTCTKPGSGIVTLKYIAGGNVQGGGQITGGMEAQQEFAFVARYGVTYDEGTLEPNNPGGWL